MIHIADMLTCDLHVRGIHELAAIKEAVGGRDHVLGGHQRAAAAVVARAHQHHPGVLVPLESLFIVQETRYKVFKLTGLTSTPPTILDCDSIPH